MGAVEEGGKRVMGGSCVCRRDAVRIVAARVVRGVKDVKDVIRTW